MAKPKNTVKGEQVLLQIFGYLVAFGLLWWVFTIKLPDIISFSDVVTILGDMSLLQIATLIVAGLAVMLVLGWTSKSTLPGLSLRDATEASATAQATSVALPVPLDLLMRLTMYQTYGFSASKSTASVVVAGVVRYFAMIFMPLVGLFALFITGQAAKQAILVMVVVAVLAFLVAFILLKMVNNAGFAKRVATWIESLVNSLRKVIKKPGSKSIKRALLKFVDDTRAVLRVNERELIISHLAWGASLYIVFLLCVRFCGIGPSELSWAQVLFITGLMLILSAVPLIPGGIGFTEAILLSTITFASPYTTAAFASALLLYRIVTWLMPIPIGATAFFVWRSRENRKIRVT